MYMQVVYLLTAFGTGVANDAKSSIWIWITPLLQGQTWGEHHHSPQQPFVFRCDLRHGGDVPLGHHQKMHRCPWVNIMESQNIFVFIDFSGWNLTSNDFAKDAIRILCAHGETIQSGIGWLAFMRTMPRTTR